MWPLLLVLLALARSAAADPLDVGSLPTTDTSVQWSPLFYPAVVASTGQVTVDGTSYTLQQAALKGIQLGYVSADRVAFATAQPTNVAVLTPDQTQYQCLIGGKCLYPWPETLFETTLPVSQYCLNSATTAGYCSGGQVSTYMPASVAAVRGLVSTCTRDSSCTLDSKPFCRTITDQVPVHMFWYNNYLQAVYEAMRPSTEPNTYKPFVKGCVSTPGVCNTDSDCPNRHKCVHWTGYTSDMHLYTASDCVFQASKPMVFPECVDDFQCWDQPGTACESNVKIPCGSVAGPVNADGGNCKYQDSTEFHFLTTPFDASCYNQDNINQGACSVAPGPFFENSWPQPFNTWRATCACSAILVPPTTSVALSFAQQQTFYDEWYKTSIDGDPVPGPLAATIYPNGMNSWKRSFFAQMQDSYYTKTQGTCPAGYSCTLLKSTGWKPIPVEGLFNLGWAPSVCLGTTTASCQYMGFASPDATGHQTTCSCNTQSIPNWLQYSQSSMVTVSNDYYNTQGCRDNCETSVCNSNGLCTYGIDDYPGYSTDLTGGDALQRSSPCDCNKGWGGPLCSIPNYDTFCCNDHGVYGYTPPECRTPTPSCPALFQFGGKVCPYGTPNVTHPALCPDGSRPTTAVTCYGLNDNLAAPSRRCTCSPGYFGEMCQMTQEQCDQTVCMNAGHCTVNPINLDIKCICDPGWATYPPYNDNVPYKWTTNTSLNPLANKYQCQYPAPEALVDKVTMLQSNTASALSVLPCGPYGTPTIDPATGLPYISDGTNNFLLNTFSGWNSGVNYNAYPNLSNGFGACTCNYDTGVRDPGTGYCVKQPTVWSNIVSNDTTGNTAGLNQPCGAPYRGQVMSLNDGFGSYDCYCYNGFGGRDCGTVVCPANRYGDPCSGPGFLNTSTTPPTVVGRGWCDHSTGHCLCSSGTVGVACEIDLKPCGSESAVYPYLGQVIS